jgi:hypothetical protein
MIHQIIILFPGTKIIRINRQINKFNPYINNNFAFKKN